MWRLMPNWPGIRCRSRESRMMGVSILDWVILLIILLSVLQAIAQGFFYEFFSLAGVIVGYLLAAWEYPRAAVWYARYVNSQWAADIAGFFTIFFVVVLLAGVVGRIARWAVHGLGRARFPRLLGAVRSEERPARSHP